MKNLELDRIVDYVIERAPCGYQKNKFTDCPCRDCMFSGGDDEKLCKKDEYKIWLLSEYEKPNELVFSDDEFNVLLGWYENIEQSVDYSDYSETNDYWMSFKKTDSYIEISFPRELSIVFSTAYYKDLHFNCLKDNVYYYFGKEENDFVIRDSNDNIVYSYINA